MSQYEPLYDSFSHGGHGGYVPTPRMSVSASVYLPGSDVDPQTGWLKPDRQRRCRTQGKKLEMERLTREQQALEESIRREMSKGGVRISVRMGVFLTALLLFICGLCVLLQQGTIADRQKDINRLERSIADCRSQNAALETQIAEASTEAAICYAAARDLNMIPAESAEAIHLVAVDTRPMASAGTETQAQADAAIEVPSAQTTSATHVPAVASN
ncbi:MAG: hypothetical protein UF351_03585 [Christensenellales bacterium]|jgi:hypothetical protein|nr:hypothetical protein [Clostridiales bacterium]MEE1439907.1 hypothetical protein [Christensenellales bacterium]HIR79820.1 hypothetical protein [Candidatus Limiplasma merdipullorum]